MPIEFPGGQMAGGYNGALLQEFQKRYLKARDIAYLWAGLQESCYFNAIPSRNRYWRPKPQQGDAKGTRLYDTTPIEATKTFVSKLHDAMTPPQVQWGYLELDELYDDDDNELPRVQAQQMLDTYMRRLFDFIHQSNFDVVINECYFDLSIGTSCIVCNSYTDEEPLLFTSIPMDILAIEEALTGRIESWYRTWECIKINEIKVRWPKAILSDALKSMVKNDKSAAVDLAEGCMYCPEMEKPYCYLVTDSVSIIYQEWLESNPGIVWRFQKVNNDTWGRGPVMDALPSMISLQEMARIELASANLNTFKPYMGFSDSVFNPFTFTLQPFTIIPIAPIGTGGQVPLIPIPDSSAPQFAQLTINDLRMQIKTILFNEVQQQQGVQPQTAYDVAIQQQQMAQRIGPLFSRLQQEFLEPLIKRVAYVLDKMGHLPQPKLKGKAVRFRYKSPLALAKGQQDVSRFTQYIQIMQGVMGPETTQLFINANEMPYIIAEQMQVDKRYLNTPEQMQELAQGMQNKQNEMQEAAMQQEGMAPPQQPTGNA